MAIRFKDLASRITGVSIPIFGVSWNPPESEREVVRETFIYLEDRRALFNDYAWEIPDHVAQSILEIRSELTSALKRLPAKSEAVTSLRAMRAACREYLDNARPHGHHHLFLANLGRLRAVIGIHVAYLSVKYGLDVDGELLRIIPVELREPKYLEA